VRRVRGVLSERRKEKFGEKRGQRKLTRTYIKRAGEVNSTNAETPALTRGLITNAVSEA